VKTISGYTTDIEKKDTVPKTVRNKENPPGRLTSASTSLTFPRLLRRVTAIFNELTARKTTKQPKRNEAVRNSDSMHAS
jgi:hypothetical protein